MTLNSLIHRLRPLYEQLPLSIKVQFRKLRALLLKEIDSDRFLRKVSGVIHIGANTGQERDIYSGYNLRVLWIEPIPEIFAQLEENITGFTNQLALQCLVTDQDEKEYPFHIANNDGASSSILDLKLHRDIWPEIDYVESIVLKSKTLPTLLREREMDYRRYDALIMDTQGSELLILQGASSLLHNFRYIKTEVPDFEAYSGCCTLVDITTFLEIQGFRELSRNKFAEREDGGSYYDVVFEKLSTRHA